MTEQVSSTAPLAPSAEMTAPAPADAHSTGAEASSSPTAADIRNPQWQPTIDQVGRDVVLDLVVRARQDKTVSSGRKMTVLEFANFAGVIKGKVWEEGLTNWVGIAPGSLVRVTARVDKGFPEGAAPELNAKGVERLDPTHPIGDALHPRYPGDLTELRARWAAQVAQLPAPHRAVLDQLLAVVGGEERFMRAPAAKGHHHAYINGLLDHSVEVCETATAMAAAQQVSDDEMATLRLGTLVHDIGKMDEYAWEGVPITVSRAGNLRSHVITGVQMLERARLAAGDRWAAAGVTPALIADVAGIIQQHHGRAAWTPTSFPKTMSAELVTTAEQAGRVLGAPPAGAQGRDADPTRTAHPGWQRVIAALPALEQATVRRSEDLALDPTRPSPRHFQDLVLAIGQQPGWQGAVNLDLAQAAAAWRGSVLGAPSADTPARRYSARAALLMAVEQLWATQGEALAADGLTAEHRLQFEHALMARSQGLDGVAPVEEPGPSWPLSHMAALADAASAWMRGRMNKMVQSQPQPDGTLLSTQRGTETLQPDIDVAPVHPAMIVAAADVPPAVAETAGISTPDTRQREGGPGMPGTVVTSAGEATPVDGAGAPSASPATATAPNPSERPSRAGRSPGRTPS